MVTEYHGRAPATQWRGGSSGVSAGRGRERAQGTAAHVGAAVPD